MKQTAQPGEMAGNQSTPPIQDRPEQSYLKTKQKTTERVKDFFKQRSPLDWTILAVVGLLALVVIALSFHNSTKLAKVLSLNPWLTAGLVEILFASLLVIRGRQRATQREVPFFLSVGYFTSLAFVTGVNMWGLALENPGIGLIVGLAISGAMWLMESTLVWLWTDSHKPHQKTAKELQREAKREIKKIKLMQRIEWMRWEAQKPDLPLIRKARKEEGNRKKTIKDGLPEFFKQAVTVESDSVPVGWDDVQENGASESEIMPVMASGIPVETDVPESGMPVPDALLGTSVGRDDKGERDNITEDGTAKQEDVKNKKVDKQKQKKKSTVSDFSTKRTAFDKEVEEAEKIALDKWKEEGKRPGRTKIENIANCSEKAARKVVKRLTKLEEEKGEYPFSTLEEKAV